MRSSLSSLLPIAIVAFASVTAPGRAADVPVPDFAAIRKIDAHSHVFEDLPGLNAMMDRLNVRTINVCVPGGDGHLALMDRVARELYQKRPDLYPFTATFDVRGVNEPGYAAQAIAWLDEAFRHGAVAVKIWKEFGMEVKTRDGKFMLPDDPILDPIYAHLAQLGKPLHAHLAEPLDAWLPLDKESNHYSYYSQNPQWHLHGKPEYPSHAAIIAARDNIMKKHPTLVVVGAHLGSLEHDLAGIAARFERYPRFHIEVAARTRDLARHPSEKVRALFLKYPDRILYGVDVSWKPHTRSSPPTAPQREGHITSMEVRYRADFDYYAGKGAMTYNGRNTEALNLPRPVLEKFYHGNAERVFKLEAAWAGAPAH